MTTQSQSQFNSTYVHLGLNHRKPLIFKTILIYKNGSFICFDPHIFPACCVYTACCPRVRGRGGGGGSGSSDGESSVRPPHLGCCLRAARHAAVSFLRGPTSHYALRAIQSGSINFSGLRRPQILRFPTSVWTLDSGSSVLCLVAGWDFSSHTVQWDP